MRGYKLKKLVQEICANILHQILMQILVQEIHLNRVVFYSAQETFTRKTCIRKHVRHASFWYKL